MNKRDIVMNCGKLTRPLLSKIQLIDSLEKEQKGADIIKELNAEIIIIKSYLDNVGYKFGMGSNRDIVINCDDLAEPLLNKLRLMEDLEAEGKGSEVIGELIVEIDVIQCYLNRIGINIEIGENRQNKHYVSFEW